MDAKLIKNLLKYPHLTRGAIARVLVDDAQGDDVRKAAVGLGISEGEIDLVLGAMLEACEDVNDE